MKSLCLALVLVLLAGCTGGLRIDDSHTATGQNSRVQYVVLHYTSADLQRSLDLLTQTEVSSHYLIGDAPPTVYRLVDENRRAWHVGVSEWQGAHLAQRFDHRHRAGQSGLLPDASGALLATFRAAADRHPDRAAQGHRQASPATAGLDHRAQRCGAAAQGRSGPAVPWKRLADEGLVPWPNEDAVARQQALFSTSLPSVQWFQEQLAQNGYTVPQHGELDEATRNVIAAFQMKYRPANYDGQPDAETAARLLVLNLQAAG